MLPGDKVAWERGFDEQSQCNGSSPANTLNTGTDRQTNTRMCANTARSVACGQPEQTAASGRLFFNCGLDSQLYSIQQLVLSYSQEILRISFFFPFHSFLQLMPEMNRSPFYLSQSEATALLLQFSVTYSSQLLLMFCFFLKIY